MWNLLLDAAYALISGEFSSWWSAHKQEKAQNAQNQDLSISSAVAQQRLRDKWERPS